MGPTIDVITLGKLRIHRNGALVEDFISAKAVLLFVYLAMNPGEHSRKKLAAMLWSETHDEQALKNLRTVLASVRQNLPDALLVEREGLAINPGVTLHVDATAFEQGVETALASALTSDDLPTLRRLADTYEGSFLSDISFREAAPLEEWIAETQRQLNALNIQLLYSIAKLAEETADYETGLEYARCLAGLDPYWDSACRQLMRLLSYTDRANEALQHYDNFSRLLKQDLGAEPEDETKALYHQIRSRQLRPPSLRASPSQIVLPDMPFVEPADDLAIIQRMLNTPQCRLLTVYGISGVGKSTLATQVAFARQHVYRDGAFFISLKRAHTARDLPHLLASALGLVAIGQETVYELETRILAYLKTRHVLLILDGYEHLLPETALIGQIVEQAPEVQLIVTSQASLGLFREWLLPLQGLPVPAADDPHPETNESVRLFELTAQRVNPRFDLRAHLSDVVEICRLVEGLPLALLIAAGWTHIVSITKIKEFIIEGQELSLPVHQGLPAHHQSLDLMLEYTWNTLNEEEKLVLSGLSVFGPSFDMDEAEQICSLSLGMLAAMLQKSLFQKYGDRYRMHQLVWRYARKKLLYSEHREALALRFLEYRMDRLRQLQSQRPVLHEYLLEIESHYEIFWNYEWMPRSIQPVYLLSLSRFLIPFWETSRKEEVSQIQAIYESFRASELSSDMAMLLHIQLARFSAQRSMVDMMFKHIRTALEQAPVDAPWTDFAALFCQYATFLRTQLTPTNSTFDEAQDSTILVGSYLKLLALYLDLCDYEAADACFPYLLESVEKPAHQAVFLASQACIAAECANMTKARFLLEEALQHLADEADSQTYRLISALRTRAASAVIG